MPENEVKNIIFDLGNTLLYFNFCYFYDGVAKLEKKLSATKLKKFIREKNLDIKLISGKLKHKDFFRILKKKFDLKIGYSDFIYFYSDIFWANIPMKKFLERISRVKKFGIYLLSNTDSQHINFVDRNFPFVRILRKRVLSFKVGLYKPQKKIFTYTLEKYSLKPENTLLIDDMKDNIDCAKLLGIRTIHYKDHRKFLSEFSAFARNVK